MIISAIDASGNMFNTPIALLPSALLNVPYLLGHDWLELSRVNASRKSANSRWLPTSPLSVLLGEQQNEMEPHSSEVNVPYNSCDQYAAITTYDRFILS